MQQYKSVPTHVPPQVNPGIGSRSGSGSRLILADSDVVFAYCVSIILAAIVGKWFLNGAVTGGLGLFSILDINAGESLALCAMASIAFEARHKLSLTLTDFLVIGTAALFFLPPMTSQSLPFLGATLGGAYFWLARRNNPVLVSLGQLWVALSTHAAWGRIIFRIISEPILRLETLEIAKLGQGMGLGLTVDRGTELSAPNGWSVYILDPCSSFHNLSLAALVWLSMLKLGRVAITAPAWAALFAGTVLIIFLNASRILLMTLSEEHYQYWHDGLGRSLFICFTFAAIALPTLASMRRSQRLQAPATRF